MSEGLSHEDAKLLAGLSDSLRPLYDLELRLGNRVVRVDDHAWTECVLAVVFERPLHSSEIAAILELPATVAYWDCTDPHYELQSGYYCEASRHSLAGPRPESGTSASSG